MLAQHHNIFLNATFFSRAEELLKTQKKRFDELEITNILDLCRYCGISERDLGSVVSRIHPFHKREAVHLIFDTAGPKRGHLEKMLEESKVERKKISHQTPLGSLSLNQISELTASLEDLDVLISNLELQLSNLPKRNGVTDGLFNSPSTEDLIEKKLVRIEGRDVVLTSRGEGVVRAAQNSFSQLRGLAERREEVEDAFLLQLHEEIKKAAKKRLSL